MQQWRRWPAPCGVYDITFRTEPRGLVVQRDGDALFCFFIRQDTSICLAFTNAMTSSPIMEWPLVQDTVEAP